MASVDRIQGLSGQQAIKTPCRLATTANITLSGEQTIDGVAAVEGDRVLVKDQTDTTQNGIYDVSTSSWTRSLDFDGPNDITDGTMALVNSGGTYADKVFKLNATEPITIDTTALTFNVATDFTSISAFASTLLDDANAAAARTTLGVVIGTDVQAYNATLAAIAAQTEAANKIQAYSADNTPSLLDFKDEDDMASDSATAVPSQQSVKAYVDASVAAVNAPVVATAQASTSGTNIDFTSIPSWATQIALSFDGLSTNGLTDYLVQVGDSGGFETSGYDSNCSASSSTAGFAFVAIATGATTVKGQMILTHIGGNKWSCLCVMARTDTGAMLLAAGTKTLTGTLDRVRITTAGGDTWDAGEIGLRYS